MIVRKPVAIGFYPPSFEELEKSIKECFLHPLGVGELPHNGKEDVLGGIAPHAGYIYSGPCASHLYYMIKGVKKRKFVIIGPNHYGVGPNIAIQRQGFWETPFGRVPIDSELSEKIWGEESLVAFKYEHSIEVQLPFLQFLFGNDFSFVPITISNPSKKELDKLAESLKKTDAILIASSDFTHYGPNYGYYPFGIGKEAYVKGIEKDKKILEIIKERDPEKFLEETKNMTICGKYPIYVILKALKDKAYVELLKYYTSADITQDFTNWVGYSSVVFLKRP